jgi:hypothetical protein
MGTRRHRPTRWFSAGPVVTARCRRRILDGAKRAAKKALKGVFGPGIKVVIGVADSPDTLAVCSRAIAGNPRAGAPYQG